MHPPDDELRQFHLRSLSPDETAMIETHLSDCKVCHQTLERFQASQKQETSEVGERRRDLRVPLGVDFTVRVLEPSAVPLSGRILDISKNGLKISVTARLKPGQYVQTRLGGRIVMAEVRYCTPEGDRFLVGLEIKDVFVIPGTDDASQDPGTP